MGQRTSSLSGPHPPKECLWKLYSASHGSFGLPHRALCTAGAPTYAVAPTCAGVLTDINIWSCTLMCINRWGCTDMPLHRDFELHQGSTHWLQKTELVGSLLQAWGSGKGWAESGAPFFIGSGRARTTFRRHGARRVAEEIIFPSTIGMKQQIARLDQRSRHTSQTRGSKRFSDPV